MKRAIPAGVTVAAVIAAAAGGFLGVRGHLHPTDTANVALVSPASAQANDDPIYYQDPDGRPLYSLTPKKTPLSVVMFTVQGFVAQEIFDIRRFQVSGEPNC